jgi:TatA/E family protein of Tat protein translocase
MFGSLGIPELILIFIVALIVFGPKRLPEIGRTLGKAMGEFKKATDDFKNTIEREVQVEELKQLASATVPVHEAISRTAPPIEPIPAAEPAESPAQTADLTPEAVSAQHDS